MDGAPPPRLDNEEENIEVVDPNFDVWEGEGESSEDEDEDLEGIEVEREPEEDEDYAPSSQEDSDEDEDEFEILDADSEEPDLSTCSSDSGENSSDGLASFKVLLTDTSVQQHGVMSSVRHHQCCDALVMEPHGSDSVTIVDGKHALLYNLVSREILASARLGFEPYSIARYGPLLAAGGDYDIAIFCLISDPSRGSSQAAGVVSFRMVASLAVGDEEGPSPMNNSLRFGKCGNELKLIAANQDGLISVFTVPEVFIRAKQRGDRAKQAANASSASSPTQSSSSGISSSCSASPSFGGHEACSCSPIEISRINNGSFLSHGLWKGCPSDPVNTMMRRVQNGAGQRQDPQQVFTDCIGRFPMPVNCAAPSPDGRWMAVVGDTHSVSLLSNATGYRMEAQVELAFSQASRRQRRNREDSCQYVAWNSSSTLVAVSSDSLRMVKVWAVGSAENSKGSSSGLLAVAPVYAVEGDRLVPRPCLALQFDPVDDALLYFVERSDRLHAVDTKAVGRRCHQVVSLKGKLREECPKLLSDRCLGGHTSHRECMRAGCTQYGVWSRDWVPAAVVTGLAVSERHGVVVACKERLLQFPVLRQWDIHSHRYFSQRFKDAVVCVLTIAQRKGSGVQAEDVNWDGEESAAVSHSGFWSLPSDLLLQIIGAAAVPFNAWITRDSEQPHNNAL